MSIEKIEDPAPPHYDFVGTMGTHNVYVCGVCGALLTEDSTFPHTDWHAAVALAMAFRKVANDG